jgi:hypothetical protein
VNGYRREPSQDSHFCERTSIAEQYRDYSWAASTQRYGPPIRPVNRNTAAVTGQSMRRHRRSGGGLVRLPPAQLDHRHHGSSKTFRRQIAPRNIPMRDAGRGPALGDRSAERTARRTERNSATKMGDRGGTVLGLTVPNPHSSCPVMDPERRRSMPIIDLGQ